MNLSFQSIADFGLDTSATVLNAGFSDYFIAVQISTAGLLSMVRQDSVDLQLSRVILQNNEPVGAALIARRGWTSRLAAMSIVPHARGHGIGAQCVKQLLDGARARGDKTMTLEVIEQNTPAVRLYEKCGFQKMRRLIGFSGQPRFENTEVVLQQTDVREVARVLVAQDSNDLPWQISGETLAQSGPPTVAYRSEFSYIALSNPDAPTIVVRAIVTRPDARRSGHATQLLRAVIARHPEKTWRVSATLPEEFGGVFERNGFTRENLSQWQMQCEVNDAN